jgi:hypothetical protein
MRLPILLAIVGLAAACTTPGPHHPPPGGFPPPAGAAPAAIPFADRGSIEDWRVQRDGSLLIEGQSHQWYRATFIGTCQDLDAAENISFDTNAGGELDRWSSIIVRGQVCPFASLTATTPPPHEMPRHPPKP